MNVNQYEFRYSGARNRMSAGTVHLAESAGKRPVVILCHGFKGFKDWGFVPELAEAFARSGYYALRFNFTHNGCSVEGAEEADLDAFRENRLSFETTDLSLLMEQLVLGELPHSERADTDSMFLVGHSRGGAAVIQCGDEEGVRGIALLASISRYPSVSEDEAKAWQSAGVNYVKNFRTGTELPLGTGLLAELTEKGEVLERAVKSLRIPICIVHGDADSTVSVDAARQLSALASNSELHLLPGGDHTFGAKHPFAGWTSHLERVRDILLIFFERVRGGGLT